MLQITMNSEKHYHEGYQIHFLNQINTNFIHHRDWGDLNNTNNNNNNHNNMNNNPNHNNNNNMNHNSNNNNMFNYAASQQDDLEYLFNNRYSDVEQYQILQQSDNIYNPNQYYNHEMMLNPIKWNEEEEPEFQSSEKNQLDEYINIQNQNNIDANIIFHENNLMRSQQNLNRNYSHRSSSASSARDNSSSQDKSSSSQNKSYSNSQQEESFTQPSQSISKRNNKKLNDIDSNNSEYDSNNNANKPAKNKQSQHKNVVKNIGLGFKNYLIDSKSPLNEKIQNILKENRFNHFEFRQWINHSVKLDQKKEIYKALNIKHEDNPKIQSYKRILYELFRIFFEEQYASSYLWRNNNIQNKEIHIEFIKHFIQSSRDTDYLLKKWK